MYFQAPTAKELEGTGYSPEDYELDPVDVWPENWDAFCVFAAIQTQWRAAGMGGATGLDYNVLYHKLDRMNLSRDDYEQMEHDIGVMETEALKTMNKKT